MARKRIKIQDASKEGVENKASKPLYVGLFFFLLGCAVTAFLFVLCKDNHGAVIAKKSQICPLEVSQADVSLPKIQNVNSSLSLSKPNQKNNRPTLEALMVMSPDDLEKVDIAVMSLVCAEGLRGSEDLNIDQCLSILDQWAEFLRKDIEKRMPVFSRYAAKYDNSINLFKVANMVLSLKKVMGVDYNLEIMSRNNYPDSKDVFIHGCLTHNKNGACVSIPTLCVALGRRLGYPLKLVQSKDHMYFRWDDGIERFNIEACCPGCDSHPDDYYLTFPKKVSKKEVVYNCFFTSLTPTEELALFLEMRGRCLFDMGETAEAQILFAQSHKRRPALFQLSNLGRSIDAEADKIKKKYQE